nr:P-loop NTPase fold protein [Nitrosomonas nitrosa]
MIADPNRHVRDYLHYYVSTQQPPNYAVLVEGPWGIGKTFLVKKILGQVPPVRRDGVDPWRRQQEYEATIEARRWHYVSLYGIASAAELDLAVLRALYPALQDARVRLFSSLAMGTLRALRYNPALQLTEILSKFRRGTYVFDDLERCEMPLKAVLGYINRFVEHSDCKVVIVASEKDIADSDEFNDQKEKIVGKTLTVRSNASVTLRAFIAAIADSDTRDFYTQNAEHIESIFAQSSYSNLRILQQTLWDFERVYVSMRPDFRAKREACLLLMRLFFALSFEVKMREINADYLKNRTNHVYGGYLTENEKKNPLATANAKYVEVNLNDPVLPEEVLIDLLIDGVCDAEAINAGLEQGGAFLDPATEPSWRIVWSSFDYSESEWLRAFKDMEEKFAAREYVRPGEMLHVFGMRLWLARIGELKLEPSDVVEECKQYVSDLYRRNQLPAYDDVNSFEIRFDGYAGLQVREHGTSEYGELFAFLKAMREKVREDSYPALARKLIEEMREDVELFVRRVCVTNSEDNLYHSTPLLAALPPDDFVQPFLNLPPSAQRRVMLGLEARYELGKLQSHLPSEIPWITEVLNLIENAAVQARPVTKERLDAFVRVLTAKANLS